MWRLVSPVTGTVWKTLVKVGQTVSAGDDLVVLESMKMEIPAQSDVAGVVRELLVGEGDAVRESDPLVVIG